MIIPKNITILLAEDHPPNVLVATSYLKYMGYNYDVARTGKEVIEKLNNKETHYDLIMMDVQMPELDGYATTQLLRQEERRTGGRRMPIIAVTAHAMPEEIRKCLDSGMDDYITKPFDPEVLEQKISALVEKIKTVSPLGPSSSGHFHQQGRVVGKRLRYHLKFSALGQRLRAKA